MEIKVSDSQKNAVHKNLILIKAGKAETAYKKAISFGRKAETSYKNPQGKNVTIKFWGISQLEEMYDTLEDGSELKFEEYVAVTPSQIRKWIVPKEKLQVFLKPKLRKKYDPDYRAQYVIDMTVLQSKQAKKKKTVKKNKH